MCWYHVVMSTICELGSSKKYDPCPWHVELTTREDEMVRWSAARVMSMKKIQNILA